MSNPFIIQDGNVIIEGAENSYHLAEFSGVGVGLPSDFGAESQKQADLLERRLCRIESVLGLGPICAD